MPRSIQFLQLLWGVLFALAASGCGDDAFRRYDSALLAIEDGRNTEALRDANSAANRLYGPDRQRAAYIAGLAAARLGQTSRARVHLLRASESIDDVVAGRAFVQLGSIELENHAPRRAAGFFESAARRLGEPAQSRAWLCAAEAFDEAKLASDARRCLARASRSTVGSSAAVASSRLESTGFTIQFGSYSSRPNADRRAAAVSATARRTGLGTVVVRHSGGAWKVQAGTFPNRRTAGAALKSLNRTDAVVKQLGT